MRYEYRSAGRKSHGGATTFVSAASTALAEPAPERRLHLLDRHGARRRSQQPDERREIPLHRGDFRHRGSLPTVEDVRASAPGQGRPGPRSNHHGANRPSTSQPRKSRLEFTMYALKAQVKNGRLVLDEPTDLPEGREVELVVLDDDEFEPEEKARLLQAIEDGIEDIEKGDYVDGMEFASELLAKREALSR